MQRRRRRMERERVDEQEEKEGAGEKGGGGVARPAFLAPLGISGQGPAPTPAL